MIYGPKEDGTYVVEFRTDGQVFALSIPRTETEVILRFKERMPYGLVVPPPRRKPPLSLGSSEAWHTMVGNYFGRCVLAATLQISLRATVAGSFEVR
jgi:hypothetical protein